MSKAWKIGLVLLLAIGVGLAVFASSSQDRTVWVVPHQTFTACGSPDCGQYAATLYWDLTIPSGTGYNMFVNGNQIDTDNASPYTFSGLDCGQTFQLGVQAHDGSGHTNPTSGADYVSYTTPSCGAGPPPPPSLQVGAPSPTGVNCTSTLNAGANVNTALQAATPGSTVCLNAGAWAGIALSSLNPSSGVTLAATPSATVNVPFITLSNVSNVTVEGFNFNGSSACGSGSMSNGVCVVQSTGTLGGGIVFQYNTIENISKAYAFGFGNGTVNQTGVTIQYNQIDHVGSCLEIDGGSSLEHKFVFSDNVCGPGLGAGITTSDISCCITVTPQHYIQLGGIDTFTADNNTFEGPYDATARSINVSGAGVHNNVLHSFSTSNDIVFNNNIMWHTQSRGQTLLLESSHFDRTTMTGNLDIEDPGCASGATSNCPSFADYNEISHTMTVANNTFQDTLFGIAYNETSAGDYPGATGYTLTNNIVEPSEAANSGNLNFANWPATCTTCTVNHNVSGDGSANSVLPTTTGNIINWAPSFVSTSWTPTSGLPYSAPPTGYYIANGSGVTSSYGYPGSGGPLLGVPVNSTAPSITGTTTVGSTLTASTGSWSNSPTSFSYQWQDCNTSGASCTNISGATSSTYVLASADSGDTLRVVVNASNTSASGNATSANTTTVSGGSGGASTPLGAANAPVPTCTVTASSVASAISDLGSASSGATVCLASGSYGVMNITNAINPTGNVTLAAATPGAVTLAGIELGGCGSGCPFNHVTVEGFNLSSQIQMGGQMSTDTFTFNTFQNISPGHVGSSVYGNPALHNPGFTQSNITVTFSVFYNDTMCLELDNATFTNWTFSHNECGAGIGSNAGVSQDFHYIQTTGSTVGLTIDNNAFIGPASIIGGNHDNVIHIDSDSSGLNIQNNIIWHGEAQAQTILVDDNSPSTFTYSNLTINNNLIVEDPTCSSACATYPIFVSDGVAGLTIQNNTVIGQGISGGGIGTGISTRNLHVAGSNYNVSNNIAVNHNIGDSDFNASGCSSGTCTTSPNVSSDGSGSITWSPSWNTTTWSWATSGGIPPFIAPPNGYYVPSSPPFSATTFGYQGTIGP